MIKYQLYNDVLQICIKNAPAVDCTCAYRISYSCGLGCPHFSLLYDNFENILETHKASSVLLTCSGQEVIIKLNGND